MHPIDDQGKWQRLVEGYIIRAPVPAAMTPYVKLVSQSAGYEIYCVSTQNDPLRLRTGTSTYYAYLGLYAKGTEVIVLSKVNPSWYEVSCPDGKRGYMASQYLTYVRSQPSIASATGQVIQPRQLRDQPFRIYRVVPELTKITVYARHVFYDLLDNMIKSYKPTASTAGSVVAQNIASKCLTGHGFTFYSDLTTTADEVEFENINPVEAMLGEGGLAEKYGAELARDWFDVFLVQRVGTDTGVQIREGKNLLGISYDVDETDVTTRIMPTGEDANGNILYLPELYIDSPYIGQYVHPKWVHLKVAEAKEVTEGENYKGVPECCLIMRQAALAEFAKGCDLPTVTLKVDFINCADTVEYQQYRPLQNVFLGDAVRVIAPRIGVEVTMRMTQYAYDCLTRKYTAMTLGSVADTLESTTISARQFGAGSITGAKLAINSIGAGHLQSGSVGSLHIKNAAIQHVHIAEALINTLSVNALTAVTARIKELVAGSITADELYASVAAIALAQLTTANITNANIQWANIDSLAATVATISNANLTTANIQAASIDWASIQTLTAAMAAIVRADIANADIDWAHIKDLVTDTAIITKGVGGELYISRLAVTEANMVSLSVGELVVKGVDGHFYSVSVDAGGNVITSLKQIGNGDITDTSINAGEKLIEGSVTAATLNTQDIFADSAIIRTLIAANLDVDTLFAREATILSLNAMDITGNEYLRLMVSGKADAGDVDALSQRMSSAEFKITEDAIISTVTGSTAYQQIYEDMAALRDETGWIVATTAPIAPTVDTLWLDTSVSPHSMKRWDGSAWTMVGANAEDYFTKTEVSTYFAAMNNAIFLKADKFTISALEGRMTTAESIMYQNSYQISLKVSTAIYDTEKVYRSSTAPASPIINTLWLDTSVSPNMLKRYTGSEWVGMGAEELKTSGITIGPNNVSITTEQFLLQLLDPANNENVLMEMSADGNVGFKALYADEVISDSVPQAYHGPSDLYIDTEFTGTSDTYFRSLGDAVRAVNNRYLRDDVTIHLPSVYSNLYEPSGVSIRGVTGPGKLTIHGYSASILNTFVTVKGCSAHILFQNVFLREIRPMDGLNRNLFLIECRMNHLVEINGCTLDAIGTTYDSIYAHSSQVYVYNTGFYNSIQGLEVYMGTGVVKSCRGACSWSMLAGAGLIFAYGTVPSGSRLGSENGQVYAANVTIDYGSPIPIVTPDQTTTQYATLTKSWNGNWRSDTLDVIQGAYSEGGYSPALTWNRGCMWFGNLRNELAFSTVKSATLTLYRKTGSGAGGASTVYLCALNNAAAVGTPSIMAYYGAIGTIGRDSQVTFGLPAAAVQGLADGSYGGLCLYESPYDFGSSTYSAGYMRLGGTDSGLKPYLTIVYN